MRRLVIFAVICLCSCGSSNAIVAASPSPWAAAPSVSTPAPVDPRTPQVALGTGWGPVENFKDETFRWDGEDAQVVVRGTGLARLTIDAEAGPGIGRPAFVLRALDTEGRQTDAAEFQGRSTAIFFLPAAPSGATYRLHVDGADRRVANPARVLDYRVFAISSARGNLFLPEIASTPIHIEGGWYGLETFSGEVFRWVDDDARFSVTASSARHATLQVVIEPGPALAGAPLDLQVVEGDRVLRSLHVTQRTTISMPVTLAAGQNLFALRAAHRSSSRAPGDPRTLDFRVFSLQLH